jgi:hypothetical protein
MWTTKEGQAALDAFRREYLSGHSSAVDRLNKLETSYANLQGRIWAVGAVWAVLVLFVMIAVRFIGH